MKITTIDGACIELIELPEFSETAVLNYMDSSWEEIHAAADDEDDATSITTTQTEQHTIITVFDYDGAPYFFIN